MKIVKNATGIIEIRNSSTNVLENWFDPTGMVGGDHPRFDDCVCISKTPTNQDEAESISIKLSDVSHIGGVAFTGTTRAELKEALVLLFKKGGGSGAGLQVTAGWQRPTDWLAIPSVGNSEEVFYGLHAVWNSTVNPVALLCTGNYTVDWGDGTVTNHSSNTKAEKNYDYSSVNSIVSTRGYKMVMIKVTPQAGATITTVSLYQRHSLYNYVYNSGFLDIKVNFNVCTYGGLVSSFVRPAFLENIEIKSFNNTNVSGSVIFSNHSRLQRIVLKSSSCVDWSNSVDGCYSLKTFDIPQSSANNITTMSYAFRDSPLVDLSMYSFPLCTSALSSFMGNVNRLPSFPNPNITSMEYGMFRSIRTNILPSVNCTNVTTFANWLDSVTRQITRSLVFGAKASHSYANQLLDATALNEIFTNLGTANASATITITGNPGAATCTQSIATSKGWTVIN